MGNRKSDNLRKRAEKKLETVVNELKDMPEMDVAKLVNELQIHQVELKMQNDELMKAHLELMKSDEKFRDLFDFAPVGYLVLDKKGTIINANLTVADQLGAERGALVKSELYKYIEDDDKDRFYLYLNKTFNFPDKHSCEISLTRKDGSKFHAQLESIVINDESHPACCRTSIIDVSNIKNAEETLRKNEIILKASLDEREILLKEIHHRVKNNMQMVNSLIGLQMNTVDDAKLREILNTTKGRITAISSVHEHLYKSSNIAVIDFNNYMENIIVDMRSIFLEASRNINIINKTENIKLHLDLAVTCGLIVNELVTNSLRHAFPDGSAENREIVIGGVSRGGKVELSVSDNGAGIPEDIDVDNIKSLGLRIVPMLAKQLQGEFSIDRKNGTKSTVTFSS
jgi:two-component system, sensor histidine kinase PdtaS